VLHIDRTELAQVVGTAPFAALSRT
jgi:hypothetical protein